jgi:Cu/Ag efflux pump CusA
VFALALLLVYLVLAGQYESWLTPIAVILAVPLSILGPVAVLNAVRIDNNLYVQIGIMLLIALSAKNAILIVEVARERVAEGVSALDAAIEGARARFRPILMTSFAFILSVVPLVLATGAGANARRSIGVTVFSGMLASTCRCCSCRRSSCWFSDMRIGARRAEASGSGGCRRNSLRAIAPAAGTGRRSASFAPPRAGPVPPPAP